MDPESTKESSGCVKSVKTRESNTDQVKVIEELRASTAAPAVARLLRDTGGEISINIRKELPSDKQYFRFKGVIDGLPQHALPDCVVNVGRVPNIRARQHVIREALNHMPLPDEKAIPEHSVSHYEVRDYSHMFDDGTSIVIEKLPAQGTLSLRDYIRALEQSKDLESTIPAAANPLRYDIGNWLGHFHNWGSEEHVVEKLQEVVRDPDLIDQHCKSISEELSRASHQFPKRAHIILDKACSLIRANYAITGKKQAFQILNGNFDLSSLHIMYSPLVKRGDSRQVPSVYVSDWRDCREGHPAFDLGSFMADLVVLHVQNTTLAGDVALGFTRGYFAKVKNNDRLKNKFIFHVLVHIGVCMIIRCRGLSEKKNDDTGNDKNTGKGKNTAKDKNNGKQGGNGNVDGGSIINGNDTDTENDNGNPKHTTNGNMDRGILKFGLMIMRHALHEDSKWFLDRPLLCHLFDVSSPKGHPGPDKWELARKSSAEKRGDQVVE